MHPVRADDDAPFPQPSGCDGDDDGVDESVMRGVEQRVDDVSASLDHDARQALREKSPEHIFPREPRAGVSTGLRGRDMHVLAAVVLQ